MDQTIFEFSFTDCNLELSLFYGLNLKKTAFINCSLISADFMEADLSQAMFDNCNLYRANFTKAKAEKTDFYTSYNFDIDPDSTKLKNAIFAKEALDGLLRKHQLIIR